MLLNVIVVLTIPFLIIAVHRAGIHFYWLPQINKYLSRCNSSQLSLAGRPVWHVFYFCCFCEVKGAIGIFMKHRCRFILFYYQVSGMPLTGRHWYFWATVERSLLSLFPRHFKESRLKFFLTKQQIKNWAWFKFRWRSATSHSRNCSRCRVYVLLWTVRIESIELPEWTSQVVLIHDRAMRGNKVVEMVGNRAA